MSGLLACLFYLNFPRAQGDPAAGHKKGRIIFQLSGLLKKLFDHEHISLTFAVVASHFVNVLVWFANDKDVTFAVALRTDAKVHRSSPTSKPCRLT